MFVKALYKHRIEICFMPTSHHEIDYLKTAFWFNETAKALGDLRKPKTPYWFAQNFNKDSTLSSAQVLENWKAGVQYSGDQEFDSSGWYRRKNGKSVPIMHLGYHPVLRVAESFPKTSTAFFSIFWRILKGERICLAEIEEWLCSIGMKPGFNLSPEGKMDIGSGRNLDGYVSVFPEFSFMGHLAIDDKFWEFGGDGDLSIHELMGVFIDRPVFKRLEITTVLLVWADQKENHDLWNNLCEYYHQLVPYVVLDNELSVRFKILDAMDGYAMKREFYDLNMRRSVKANWADHDIKPVFYDHYFSNLTLHPLFDRLKETDEIRSKISNFLTNLVCENELLWKEGEGLWWDAGFLLHGLCRGKVDKLRKAKFYEKKGLKRKFTSGLLVCLENPDMFEVKYSSF